MAALMCLKEDQRRLSKQPMFIPAFATAVDILNVMSFVELQITNDVLSGGGGVGGEEKLTKQNKQALGVSAATATLMWWRLPMNRPDTKLCEWRGK